MVAYTVTDTFKRAWKGLARTEPYLAGKLRAKLDEILEDPFVAGRPKTGPLAGHHADHVLHEGKRYVIAWYLKAGGKAVILTAVGPHDKAYEQAKREEVRRKRGVQETFPLPEAT
jgi:mRNA-degrading endonuclease RelE of RelBE toxin-antitoxin system